MPIFFAMVHVWAFLFCIYSPVLILAFFSKIVYFKNCRIKHKPAVQVIEKTTTADETILSAITVLCKIGGYLVLFSILIIFLRRTEWLPDELRLLLIGGLEMTTAIREFSSSLPPAHALTASVAALTFGGCSGIFQTKAVIQMAEKKAGLSIRPYIIWKLFHAVLSAGLTAVVCNIYM